MDKDSFRLDKQAKGKINGEFARQDDTARVNGPRKRPAPGPRPPQQSPQPGRQAPPPRRPYPPYPQQGTAQGQPRPEPRRMKTGGQTPPRPPRGSSMARQHPPYPPEQQPRRRVRKRVPGSMRNTPQPAYVPEYIPEYDPVQPEEKPKKHRLGKLLFRIAVICVVITLLNVLFFYYSGELWFNEPRKRDYPVRGAVVSEKLGKMDWEKFAGQSISFAYIRATRGTAEIDDQYKANRRGANNTDLLCGYWHEFDFRVDGKAQAENYIKQVGDLDGKLMPMVKVTRYGIYRLRAKDKAEVVKQLKAFLDRIEEEYDTECIIQCDNDCYERYIGGEFDDPLWLISHFSEPDEDSMGWTLWEYNPRVRSVGYSNRKKYFSMSVYPKGKKLSSFENQFLLLYEDEEDEENYDEGYYEEQYY